MNLLNSIIIKRHNFIIMKFKFNLFIIQPSQLMYYYQQIISIKLNNSLNSCTIERNLKHINIGIYYLIRDYLQIMMYL